MPIGAGYACTVHTPSDILKTSDSPVLVLARHTSLPLVKVLLPSGEESWWILPRVCSHLISSDHNQTFVFVVAKQTLGLPLHEVTDNQAAYNLKRHGLQYDIRTLDMYARIKVSTHEESGWWCASLPGSIEIFYV
jgi:hypothetical protein